jgi:hypothetical protein
LVHPHMIRYLNGGGGEANYTPLLTSIRNQQSETESFIIRGFVLCV